MPIKEEEKRGQASYALAAFLSVLLFVIIYQYALEQFIGDELTDLKWHTRLVSDIHLDRLWTTWLKVPYLMWHFSVKAFIKFAKMPITEAAACVQGLYAGLTYWLTFYLLDKTASGAVNKDIKISAAFVSFMLGLVMPLYVYWFNPSQYIGQFSINPIHNPTHMAVKPFGLICFMLAVDLLLLYKGKEPLYFDKIKKDKPYYILFSVFLLVSAFTKPTFMYMLLPAGAGYLLIDLLFALIRKDGSWKKVWGFMWRIGCASVPAILYLFMEYAAFYLWGGEKEDSIAIYPFLTLWHMISASVSRSLRLSMAFPFWMVVTNPRYFWKSIEGRLSIIGYIVGTLEFSFFVETGERMWDLNFAWCMMSGMLLLWVVSAVRLIVLTGNTDKKRGDILLVTIGWILLSIHLFSGLYYINPH